VGGFRGEEKTVGNQNMGEPKPWKEVGGPLRIFHFLKKRKVRLIAFVTVTAEEDQTQLTHTHTQQIMEEDTLDGVFLLIFRIQSRSFVLTALVR